MSTSHIPQPDAGAPDEVFDSVSSQVVQPVVSGLGIPAGPPQEIPVHTGQINTFDLAIHRQWVPTDVVVWTVTQTAGTLIWKKPIHPAYMNELVAYLSGIYNTWGGSADYRFKIAGTGFHAGAIAIVRIPPNRKPEDFPTPASWGAFEYLVLDPKTLETESVGVSDQRPITFHYFPFNEQDPMSFGGWIAMYVLIPLNTSSTGSQQIAIQCFNKPGQTFMFSQMIMPSYKKEVDVIPAEYKSFFKDLMSSKMTTARFFPDHIQVEPADVKETFFVANCYDVNGKALTRWITETASSKPANVDDLYVCETLQDKQLSWTMYTDYFSIVVPGDPKGAYINALDQDAASEQFTNVDFKFKNTVYFSIQSSNDGGTLKASTTAQVTAMKWKLFSEYTDNTVAPAASGESPMVFYHKDSGAKSIQTQRLTRLFRRGFGQQFLSNTCLLFLLVDGDTELPLAYVKLYPEGFFSARSTKDAIIFKKSVYFTFAGYIAKTDPLPYNAEYNKNLMLYRALSR